MADNDRWRSDPGRDRAEGRYEDWGGRADRGRFTGEGGSRGGVEGRYEDRGGRPDQGRFAREGGSRGGVEGSYEDFGGRPDRGRLTEGGGGGPRGGTEGYGYGGGYRTGEDRGGYEGGFGGDYYSGFYGADQAYGRGEDRAYGGGSSDTARGGQRGYLDSPRSGAWRDYADTGRGETRGFWDRATDEVSSWFRGGRRGEYEGRGAHRGRGPKGYTRSDDRIREDVSDRLTDDSWVDASDIEVSVANREVTLSGTVDSREAKRRAEDIAESVPGVVHVQNNLRVAGRAEGASPQGAASPGVTTPPLGESITAMNSSDANRIAAETAESATRTPGTGSRRR